MYRSHAMQPTSVSLIACAAAILSGCGTNPASGPASSSGTVSSSLQQPVAAPTLGYVWDPASAILRGINGVPGAAVLSTSGNIGSGFLTAAASASSGYALLLGPGSGGGGTAGSLYLANLPGGAPRLLASGRWTNIALSPSGSYAVVYSLASQSTVLVSGLPQQPAIQRINLSGVPQLVDAAASDTGAALIATTGTSGAGISLFAASPSGSPRAAATLGSLGGIAFIPATDTALAADATSGGIQKISTVGSTPVATALNLGGSSGMPQAIGLVVTTDAHYALLANAAGRVLRIDLTSQSQPVFAQCNCVPVTVTALTGSAVRLTAPGGGPIWIVDAGNSTPRALFIPDLAGRGQSAARTVSRSGGAL